MNIVDYVIETKNTTFKQSAFNEVDALVFAQLSYFNFSLLEHNVYLKELKSIEDISCLTRMRNLNEIDAKLLYHVIRSKRFENVFINKYESDFDIEYEKQFAAISFLIAKDEAVVAFRGTDGTIVGWKENFNMTYLSTIPSQVHAAEFLNVQISNKAIKKVHVVGHSKGGNLAVYAASRVHENLVDKIATIYNFDGPGFRDLFYATKSYRMIKDKIKKFIPPQSCVGRIMLDEDYIVIASDDTFIYQHWLYNWIIEKDKIKRENTTSFVSDNIDLTLDDVLEELSIEERRKVVDMFYDIFKKNELIYVDDVLLNKKELFKFLKNYLREDKEKRAHITKFFWRLLVIFVKNYVVEKKSLEKTMIKEDQFESKPQLHKSFVSIKQRIKNKFFNNSSDDNT